MDAVLIALGVVFLAELGDKSQLIALTFAARGRPLAVLAGIGVAIMVLQAIAVGVGAAVRESLPERPVEIVAGLAFLAFGVLALRGEDDEEVRATVPRSAVRVALAAGIAFFVAELGDKTQLATLTLAATNGPVGTWIGAVVGELAADALAIGVGARLGTRLSGRAIRWASAGAFAAFGVLLLAGVG
ncbi:MAG TPA: TMEM165/GDT1 family protein [Acidimicrobiales bacterium]|nr:TMEM165/GDT1 family protein [Acidimicrobiales bacterium]